MVESLKFYAHDVKYLIRNGINKDKIFNEFEFSTFEDSYDIEIYVKNVQNFGGDGQFMGKFSVEVRDQLTITMSIRSFNEFIKEPSGLLRPTEGDVIYVPFLGAAYEIRFVENAAIFFQLGKIQCWDLTVEVFEYSNEIFNTGVEVVDDLYNSHNFSNTANLEVVEKFAQNQDIEDVANPLFDWSDIDPFGEDF